MLLELRVENYAIIDRVDVEFSPGLNLVTGETGAGKSILIDALALLLGEKASSEVVRHGADKAVISAVFHVESDSLNAALEANGIDVEQDLIVRREIALNGRGRVFINNQPATVAVLRQLAPHLATIHAQNETLLSFDAAARLHLLDSYAASDLRPVAEAHQAWRTLREQIAQLQQDEQDRLRMVDLWSFQQKEIASARPISGEDEQLEAEKLVLANAEKIYNLATTAYDLLYEGEGAAATGLRSAARNLEDLARFEPRWLDSAAALDSARLAAEDVAMAMRDYAAGINASPDGLAEIEDRLALLDRLKRKYGQTLTEVIAYGEEVERKLRELENKDETLAELNRRLGDAAEVYVAAARALSRQRHAAARKLEKLAGQQINDLAMNARFGIDLNGTDDEAGWSATGFDSVQYLISANPGEPLAPVEKIASGGELSRVMLALKSCVAQPPAGSRKNASPAAQRTMVFDEIDTGIGGRAAEAVGRKLKALAQSAQVLCVTHLPQIASFADQHYVIEKHVAGEGKAGRTNTTVRRLNGTERTEEIARMLSGAKLTETSLKHAEQMLKANAVST
ncbi:MAG TPA: DNA repair protein RecN [Terriglobales bacterium]|nr:DNA repair protein RecN [Terriglobales bacterium]